MTKKYEDQIRDVKSCLGYVLNRVGVSIIPESIREELTNSISEVRIESKEFTKTLQEFDSIMKKLHEKHLINEE